MAGVYFNLANDPSCPTERWNVELTKQSIIETAKSYLVEKQRRPNIEQIMVKSEGTLFNLNSIPEDALGHINNCMVILYTSNITSKITLYFATGSNRYPYATPYELAPIAATIKQTAKDYLATKQSGSTVIAVQLKKLNGTACNLDKIPASELPEYNKGTAIVYFE